MVSSEENLEKAFKRIAELEEKISNLLSCKNCPENKGGLICQKEYENKCLAQKIEFIKELQEENASKDIQIKELQEQKCYWKESSFDWRHKFFKKDEVKRLVKKDKQLTKAKKILEGLLTHNLKMHNYVIYNLDEDVIKQAEQFLSEVEKGQ